MYSRKTNTDAALDSFRRGVSERWSNILRNLLPSWTHLLENSNLAWVGNLFREGGGGISSDTGAILLPLSLYES